VRELHDGLGSQLVGVLTLSEQQAKGESLRNGIHHALNELRTIMDSLDMEADVLTMLGTLRQRLGPGLQQAGVGLEWDVHCKPNGLLEGPETSLHIMRIVQEAINNSMRHGKPNRVIFRMNRSGFLIADNGCGFTSGEESRGHGLNNIEWRSTQLGAAAVKIRSSERGTIIKVFF